MKQRTKNKRKSLNNLGSSAIFKYWKSAQQLQNLFNEHSDIESLPNIYLSLESLLSGKLNTHEFQSFTNQLKLNELAGKESKSRQFILDRGNDKLIGVVLSPCQLHPSSNSQAHDLFLVPARIDLDGNLHTYPQYTPWIPRMYLEPSSEDNLPIISDIESTKKIFEIFVKKEISNFSDYIKVALLCFNKATGSKFDSIEIEGYRSSTKIALKIAPKRISHDSIAKLYELLDQGKIEAGSIPSFTKNRPEKIYYKHSKPQLFKTSRLHVAHFNNDFCLSPSQRNSLYKFFRLQNNSALPVDGPPGTGKTTLIQAIIANTFVSSALLNLNTPPIVVVCGATNQSVTNVIDSLNQQNSDDLLSSRWIPNLQSYGLFCASKNQSLTNTKYHVENRQNTGYFFELLNDANIYEIEKYYLDRFNSTFDKKVKSIATATK